MSSTQTRKQRKYRYNAPLHARHKFLSSHLSKELRARYKTRSLPLRKGDFILIARGGMKHMRGKVESVDTKSSRVSIEGIKVKKTDGSEVPKLFRASRLTIVELNLDDKRRQALLERKGKKKLKKDEIKESLEKDEKQKEKIILPAKEAG